MRALRWIVAAIVVGGALWIGVDLLREAYGAGPPYYGRTVNMDKWTSPWGLLAVVAVVATGVVALLLKPWQGRTHKRR